MPAGASEHDEDFLARMADEVALKSGPEFYEALIRFIARELEVDHALIGQIRDTKVETVAYFSMGRIEKGIVYDLAGTPCEHVVDRQDCFYPCGVSTLFPEDQALADQCIESYSGIPIRDSEGQALGIIAVMSGTELPPESDRRFRSILKLFSGRVAYEMERERLRLALERSLREKDFLISEIQHRVKNNLALIVSLLGLQSTLGRNFDNQVAIKEASSRVMAISLLYQRVYGNERPDQAEAGAYLKNLVEMILSTVDAAPPAVRVSYDLVPYEAGIDTLLAVGLVVNELVSNSLKYAFPGNPEPKLEICLKRTESLMTLEVHDNGPGLSGRNAVKAGRLGMAIVQSMASQLAGSFETVEGSPGLIARLAFPARVTA